MSSVTNDTNISLPMAVWLAYDSYDYNSDPSHISATGLLTPIKELALRHHPDLVTVPTDVSQLRASRVGTSVHDSISAIWLDPVKRATALKALGYPDKLIERVKVHPSQPSANPSLDVYSEVRRSRQLGKWTISGETDFHSEEMFQDFKTTGTYTYQQGTKDDDYIKQLSIYRWIFSDLPSNGLGQIHFLFSNWTRNMINQPNYPQSDIITKEYELWSPDKTEAWIVDRLEQLEEAIKNLEDQSVLPTCSAKETWKGPSEFKYYKTPGAKRATKVFGTDAAGAYSYLQEKSCGEVKEFPSTATYCKNYCSVSEVCEQGICNNAE